MSAFQNLCLMVLSACCLLLAACVWIADFVWACTSRLLCLSLCRRKPADTFPHRIMITGASSGIGEALALHYAQVAYHRRQKLLALQKEDDDDDDDEQQDEEDSESDDQKEETPLKELSDDVKSSSEGKSTESSSSSSDSKSESKDDPYPLVLILSGRNAKRLREVAAACRKLGASVHGFVADVRDRQKMHELIVAIDNRWELDLMVANAGVAKGTLPSNLGFEDSMNAIMDVNVMGVCNCVNPILPRFAERKSGAVAIMGSVAGWPIGVGHAAYFSSKACVRVYAESLRHSFSKYNVNISLIAPGFVRSRMTDKAREAGITMPWFWETDKAAAHIADRLMANDAIIAFPTPMFALAYMQRAVPPAIWHRVLSFISRWEKATPLNELG